MKTYILTEDQRKLVEENMKLVPFALNLLFGHDVASDEDIQSIGSIGLCKAAATYKLSTGSAFSTYAVRCISREVSNHYHSSRYKCRNPKIPPISINTIIDVGDDGVPQELIDFIPDSDVDVENEALNKILCEQALPYTPTFAMLEEQHLTISEAARQNNTSKQVVHSRMLREFRRARAALMKGDPTPISI